MYEYALYVNQPEKRLTWLPGVIMKCKLSSTASGTPYRTSQSSIRTNDNQKHRTFSTSARCRSKDSPRLPTGTGHPNTRTLNRTNGLSELKKSATVPDASKKLRHRTLLVIGAATVDIVSRATAPKPIKQTKVTGPADWASQPDLSSNTTVPGTIELRPGGVARNVHEATIRLGCDKSLLVAPIGHAHDPFAAMIDNSLKHLRANVDGLIDTSYVTPRVNLFLDEEGVLKAGVAETSLVERTPWRDVRWHMFSTPWKSRYRD